MVTGLFGIAGACATAGDATASSIAAVANSALDIPRENAPRSQFFLLVFIVFSPPFKKSHHDQARARKRAGETDLAGLRTGKRRSRSSKPL
jgi:hypothetical protein